LFYETAGGRTPVRDWLDELEAAHNPVYGTILSRLARVERGNLGDCESVGGGVKELVIDYGPEYRVYFGEDGSFVILLCGGSKKTQPQDIKTAKEYWIDYHA
jgi:putative addiction module killer protein